MIDWRKLRGPLRVPIDESRDVVNQYAERFRAAYQLFDIDLGAPNADALLICALIEEVFPQSFRCIAKKPRDPRQKIPKPAMLRKIVAAVTSGTVACLGPDEQSHANAALKWLSQNGRRPTKRSTVEALSKCKGTPWTGKNPDTIRDYLYRDQQHQEASKDKLIAGLERSKDEIFRKHSEASAEFDE